MDKYPFGDAGLDFCSGFEARGGGVYGFIGGECIFGVGKAVRGSFLLAEGALFAVFVFGGFTG